MRTFGGIEPEYSGYDNSSVLLQSIPYDGTSTWVKGADRGFESFLEASENMELYDIETDSEVYKTGIHILPEITEKSSPEEVYKKYWNPPLIFLSPINTSHFLVANTQLALE